MSVKTATKVKIMADVPPWDWPEDAGATLLAALNDRHLAEPDRLRAADLSGNLVVMTDELAAALLGILEDPSEAEELRGLSAISLGPVLEEMDDAQLDEDEDVDAPVSEATFQRIQKSFHRLALDAAIPTDVRRRVLEASVRAPEDWHQGAIRWALASGEEVWELTAVFCMQYIKGFDLEIVSALESESPEIHIEAVRAAGAWSVEAAWPHLAALLTSGDTTKSLLLEAIDAAAFFSQEEAICLLGELTSSGDEDIADAAFEALAMAEAELSEFLDDDEDDPDDEDRVR